MDIKLYIENEKDNKKLKQFVINAHPYDIASVFDDLSDEDRNRLYHILTSNELADIFSYLDDEKAADYLEEMNKVQSSSILNEMDIDDAVDIVQELDNPQEIVGLLEDDVKEDINDLKIYEDDMAGSIMTTNYIEISSDMDVKEAMKILIANASDTEIIDTLFVCDHHSLVGTLDLKELIVARSPKKISEIMNTNYICADVTDDIEEVNKLINNYDIYALPILKDNKLCGIITIDDAFEAIEESIKQDYKQMAAINSITKDDNFIKRMIKRLPWLLVLLVLSLLVSNFVRLFEDVINQVLILAFFQTMLLDMAGNVGTQSLAVTIQKMTNDEISDKGEIRHHILREMSICVINSLLLAIISYVVCLIFMTFKYTGEESIFMLALVISLSLFIVLIISGTFATVFPLLLRKMNIDPAVASGPFITTLNDIISIFIYFTLAILLLGLVM